MFCCSTEGTKLPPMVVYKTMLRVVYQSWCERGTAETTYEVMKNGWFHMNKFNQWYKQAWIYKCPYWYCTHLRY
jgi:hypothetical protein